MAKPVEKSPQPSAETPESESSPKIETASANGAPTREQIEVRAFELYLERGSADGQDVQDWLEAERELLEAAEKADGLAKAAGA